jgi:hypothetical protein
MATVRPVEAKDEVLFRRTSIAAAKGSVIKEHIDADVGQVSTLNKASDDECESLTEVLSPLLTSMRLCGQYFKWPFDKSDRHGVVIDGRNSRAKSAAEDVTSLRLEKVSAIYAIVVTSILCMNSVRLLTAFTSADKALPTIVMKFMIVIWNVQCAMQQTAYFLASRNGNFQRVLDDIRIKSASSGAFVRRLASRFTMVTWLMVAFDVAFNVYNVCFSGGLMDVFLAPFGTYINFPQFTSLRPVLIIVCIHLYPAWCFPVAMTFMLSCIIAHQFRSIANSVRQMSNDPEKEIGIWDTDIEEIRLQHQELCRIVDRADRFLKLYHMAAFFGPLTEVISIVYLLLLYPSQVKNSPIILCAFGFWLITSILELGLVVGGGILVNHYVRINASQRVYRPTKCIDVRLVF